MKTPRGCLWNDFLKDPKLNWMMNSKGNSTPAEWRTTWACENRKKRNADWNEWKSVKSSFFVITNWENKSILKWWEKCEGIGENGNQLLLWREVSKKQKIIMSNDPNFSMRIIFSFPQDVNDEFLNFFNYTGENTTILRESCSVSIFSITFFYISYFLCFMCVKKQQLINQMMKKNAWEKNEKRI